MNPTTQEKAYTIIYSQPELVSRNPVKFEWEINCEHTFMAKDDGDAHKKACRFLGRDPVKCDNVTERRKGTRLKQDHPYRIVHEFYSAPEIKALAS